MQDEVVIGENRGISEATLVFGEQLSLCTGLNKI